MDFDVSSIRLYVFDFDGTLVQSNHVKKQAFFDVVGQDDDTKIQALKSIIKNGPHLDRYGIFDSLAQQFEHLDSSELAKSYGLQCEKVIFQVPEVPGAVALLSAIQEQDCLAVVNSATPQVDLKRIVSQLDMKDYIDAVYGTPKTKTENLNILMERYELSAAQILVIGDGENDRVAAQNIGCSFYGIKNEYSDLDSSFYTLHDDLNDLLTSITQLRKEEHV